MKEQLDKLISLWTNLSFNQRVTLGTLCIASIIVAGFLFTHSQEDYDVMLSNLDPTDAAAVVHNLKQQGVAYKLAEGGTTILVPRSRKEELRLDAFKDDLIKGDKTVGYGALSSLPFGMTDWQEQKYDQKIVSDEVVNTLEKIEGIKKARVILAQPQTSLFNNDKQDSSASVMLITEPGFRVKPEQVKTIRNLVAHSVPGLKPENVALSDSTGNSLSDDMDTTAGGGKNDDDSPQTRFEKQKAKDIMDMLTAVVGPNNARVKVSAVMNFDKSESRIKRFIPAGGSADSPTGIPVSVQQNTESYANGASPKKAGGEPGTKQNIPSYTSQDVSSANSKAAADKSYQNQQVTTNYEISSEEKTVVHAPGTVERMTVAVVLNKVLTESETKEIASLVSSASGLDPSRGDVITVSGLQFSPELQDEQQKSLDILKQTNQQQLIVTLAQLGGIFLLAAGAIFVVFKMLSRPLQGQLVAQGGGGGRYALEETFSQFEEDDEPLLAMASIPALETRLDPEIEHMRESISSAVTKDPGEAARVLITYMKDL